MYAINIIKNERGRDIETTENASTEVQLKKNKTRQPPHPNPKKIVVRKNQRKEGPCLLII